jgi:hypothetical protein
MTPDSRLVQAAGTCLLDALAARSVWDEDPELAFLHDGGTAVVPGSPMLPAAAWKTDRPPQILAELAAGIGRHGIAPGIAALLARDWPGPARGLMLRHEVWIAPPAPVGQPSPRPSRHPLRTESRIAFAVIDGTTITALQPRGRRPALFPAAVTLIGDIPDALAALFTAITATRN